MKTSGGPALGGGEAPLFIPHQSTPTVARCRKLTPALAGVVPFERYMILNVGNFWKFSPCPSPTLRHSACRRSANISRPT